MTFAMVYKPTSLSTRPTIAPALLTFPWTVERYHHAIQAGVLPDGAPYELIDGQILRKDRSKTGEDPMTIGVGHVWTVKTFGDLGVKLARLGCHMQSQSPITIAADSESEPDAAILIGTRNDYRKRLPTGTDVTCVIEVADSSLQFDRTTKQRLYATANIPQYVIINLLDRCAEVHTDPQPDRGLYGKRVVVSGKEKVELLAVKGKRLAVTVKSLLP